MTAIAPSPAPAVTDGREAAWPRVRIVPNHARDDSTMSAEPRMSDGAGLWDDVKASPTDAVTALKRRLSLMRVTSECIDELREIDSVRRLIDLAPGAVCRLGFDRAMISKVEGSVWTVERTHCARDPRPSGGLDEQASRSPLRVPPSLREAEMIRRQVPLLVKDAQDPHVHRGLAAATGSRSYVAAPIMPAGRVIGFLHADRLNQGADVDEADREALSYFAEQFSRLLERTILLERFETLRHTVESMASSLGMMAGASGRNAVEMPGRDGPATPVSTLRPAPISAPAHQHPDCFLTRREIDVLELMATGYTNARIAAGLVISEGTVKSHVKHILRKLSASNRAEAVSRWLQRPATS